MFSRWGYYCQIWSRFATCGVEAESGNEKMKMKMGENRDAEKNAINFFLFLLIFPCDLDPDKKGNNSSGFE